MIRLGRRRPYLPVACRRVLTRPGRSVVRRWNLRGPIPVLALRPFLPSEIRRVRLRPCPILLLVGRCRPLLLVLLLRLPIRLLVRRHRVTRLARRLPLPPAMHRPVQVRPRRSVVRRRILR